MECCPKKRGPSKSCIGPLQSTFFTDAFLASPGCYLQGYLAGVAVPALVQLRDQFGNNRTSSSPNLLFQVWQSVTQPTPKQILEEIVGKLYLCKKTTLLWSLVSLQEDEDDSPILFLCTTPWDPQQTSQPVTGTFWSQHLRLYGSQQRVRLWDFYLFTHVTESFVTERLVTESWGLLLAPPPYFSVSCLKRFPDTPRIYTMVLQGFISIVSLSPLLSNLHRRILRSAIIACALQKKTGCGDVGWFMMIVMLVFHPGL